MCGPISLLSVMLPVVAVRLTAPRVSIRNSVRFLLAASDRLHHLTCEWGDAAVVTKSRPADREQRTPDCPEQTVQIDVSPGRPDEAVVYERVVKVEVAASRNEICGAGCLECRERD